VGELDTNTGKVKLELLADGLRSSEKIKIAALGISMLPVIWPGDLLTIQQVPWSDIKRDDIVAIVRDARWSTHRVVELFPDHLLTRGDAMDEIDPSSMRAQVLGLVVRIERNGKEFIPSRRRTLGERLLAWLLCHSARTRSLALRMHHAKTARNSLEVAAKLRPSTTR